MKGFKRQIEDLTRERDEARRQLKELNDMYQFLLHDTVDTETRMEEIARKMFGDEYVDGDEYFTPCELDFLDKAHKELVELRKLKDEQERQRKWREGENERKARETTEGEISQDS